MASAQKVLSVGLGFPAFDLGESDDSDGQVPLRYGSLGKLGAADRYARVLVPGLSVLGRRQRNGWRLLSHGGVQGCGKNTRLLEHRGQRQSNAPSVLRGLRYTAF